jgi:hypothetical protein
MYVVGYTRNDADGRTETIKHQEYDTKQEAIEGAEALAFASVSDETIEQVLRGTKIYDGGEDYNVLHEIPR